MLLTELGAGPQRAKTFEQAGLTTSADVVRALPEKYTDCRFPVRRWNVLPDTGYVCAAGKIAGNVQQGRGGYVGTVLSDTDGNLLRIQWFGQPYVAKLLRPGMHITVCGQKTYSPGFGFAVTAERFGDDGPQTNKIYAKYRKFDGIGDGWYRDLVSRCLAAEEKNFADEWLPERLRAKYGLCTEAEAVRWAHSPETPEQITAAKKRLTFDSMFFFSFRVENLVTHLPKEAPFVPRTWNCIGEVTPKLGFALTADQKNALNCCMKDMMQGKRLNCLVQGDVGSGKTMVALFLSFITAENGYQSAVLAPTEVLARQHYAEFCRRAPEFLRGRIVLVLGTEPAKQQKLTDAAVESGQALIVIGTVAVLNRKFSRLGFVCADEQHRFGVEQREYLLRNTVPCPHFCAMTATPIPRTLALASYGAGTDIYLIKQKPPGRIPVSTVKVKTVAEAAARLRSEIENGNRAYCVCPLVSESDAEGMENIMSAEEAAEYFSHEFADIKGFKCGLVTGAKKPEENAAEIAAFASGETRLLCATTVIEVGVNVPEATAIALLGSERFGLAQMHQLRGRVGRGKLRSYCILQTEKDDKKAEIMCSTDDGFKIAELDFQMRGCGEYAGTKQSGKNRYAELMQKYPKTYAAVAADAAAAAADPVLSVRCAAAAEASPLHEVEEKDTSAFRKAAVRRKSPRAGKKKAEKNA